VVGIYKIFILNKNLCHFPCTKWKVVLMCGTTLCNTRGVLTIIRCILFLKLSCEATSISRSPSSKGHLLSTPRVLIVANYFQKNQKELNSKLLLKLSTRLRKVRIFSSIVCTGMKADMNLGTLIFSYLTMAWSNTVWKEENSNDA